jgi:hypothetical protein
MDLLYLGNAKPVSLEAMQNYLGSLLLEDAILRDPKKKYYKKVTQPRKVTLNCPNLPSFLPSFTR